MRTCFTSSARLAPSVVAMRAKSASTRRWSAWSSTIGFVLATSISGVRAASSWLSIVAACSSSPHGVLRIPTLGSPLTMTAERSPALGSTAATILSPQLVNVNDVRNSIRSPLSASRHDVTVAIPASACCTKSSSISDSMS